MEEVVIADEDKDVLVYKIRFDSGFEIWGLPSVARSLRSKQGHVIIDEAAFVDDLFEVISAAMALEMWGRLCFNSFYSFGGRQPIQYPNRQNPCGRV